jgi:ABC-type transport system substrate-binding protein
MLDRVEWKMIPDAQTGANALLTSEVDWMEIPLPDLIPLLKSSPGVVTGNLDAYGQILLMRPNHTAYPTSDPAIRQAMPVLLHPSDHIYYNPTSAVVSQMLSECGFNVDDQVMDWATVQSRRTSREKLTNDRWSIFCTVVPVPDYRDPLLAAFIRGDGAKGWFGWPADAPMEQIYAAWLETTDSAEQTRLERDYQL